MGNKKDRTRKATDRTLVGIPRGGRNSAERRAAKWVRDNSSKAGYRDSFEARSAEPTGNTPALPSYMVMRQTVGIDYIDTPPFHEYEGLLFRSPRLKLLTCGIFNMTAAWFGYDTAVKKFQAVEALWPQETAFMGSRTSPFKTHNGSYTVLLHPDKQTRTDLEERLSMAQKELELPRPIKVNSVVVSANIPEHFAKRISGLIHDHIVDNPILLGPAQAIQVQ